MTIKARISTAFSILLFLVLFGGVLFAQAALVQTKTLLVPPELTLVGAEDAEPLPEGLGAEVKARLANAPLNQPALNLLYAWAVRSGADQAERDRIRKLLKQMGWRHTPTQQNLIVHAVENRDFETIVRSSDALLRREQAPDQMIQLLHLVETELETRRILVERLSHDPAWFRPFFQKTELLAGEAQVLARAETLSLMFDKGQEMDRRDLAPSLNAMIDAGQFDSAQKLYRSFTGTSKSGILNDPEFLDLARSRDERDYRAFPFEWTVINGRGLQVSVIESIGNAAITVRWNGKGSPLMMRQVVALEPGKRYSLELTGLDATADLLKIVNFGLLCPEGLSIFRVKNYDPKSKSLSLETTNAIPCDFPKLDVRGRVQDVSRPREFSLSSLQAELIE